MSETVTCHKNDDAAHEDEERLHHYRGRNRHVTPSRTPTEAAAAGVGGGVTNVGAPEGAPVGARDALS